MRRWLLAAVAAFAFGVHAADQASEPVVSFAVPEQDGVTVTAIPAPMLVLQMELRNGSDLRPLKSAKAAKKLKQAKLQAPPKSMLSRTERHQMALMVAAKPQTQGSQVVLLHLFDDEDAGSGPEDIDLHRSFSRPRVAEVAELEIEDDADDELSDTIKLRLLIARTRAVQLHEKKFS